MVKQLASQTSGKNTKFKISKKEFKSFERECIFDQIKGIKMGRAFCTKYKVHNNILEMLSNESAKYHIQKFYVK